jgi:hypothetical protein
MDDKKIGMGIVASTITGTISTILAGIILNCITPTSSGIPGDKPLTIENKPAPPKGAPAPFEGQSAPQPPAPPSIPLPVSPSDPQTFNTLRDQLAAQQEEMHVLRRTIDELKRDAAHREDAAITLVIQAPTTPEQQGKPRAEANRLAVNISGPKPEEHTPPRQKTARPSQTPVVLYYRVAWQTTKQIEYAHIDEVTDFLQSIRLSYIRGIPYHDSGLSPWCVPIAICKTSSWQSYVAKSVAHRERMLRTMSAMGIETRIEEPEEVDD